MAAGANHTVPDIYLFVVVVKVLGHRRYVFVAVGHGLHAAVRAPKLNLVRTRQFQILRGGHQTSTDGWVAYTIRERRAEKGIRTTGDAWTTKNRYAKVEVHASGSTTAR